MSLFYLLSMCSSLKDPNKVCNLEVIDKTSNGFTIRWQPPCLSHGYLKGYEVRLQSDVTCQLVKFGDTAESGQEEGDAETQGNVRIKFSSRPRLNNCSKYIIPPSV